MNRNVVIIILSILAALMLFLDVVCALTPHTITIHSIGIGEATITKGSGHEWIDYVMDGSTTQVNINIGDTLWIQDISPSEMVTSQTSSDACEGIEPCYSYLPINDSYSVIVTSDMTDLTVDFVVI